MKTNIKILFITMLTFFVLVGSNCFAAGWWGTPGYEWARTKGLTSIKTQSQLNKDVTISDYYTVILKYLSMKKVEPKNVTVQNFYVDGLYNGVIEGFVKDINSHISKKSLTPQEYRRVDELITHGKSTLEQYSDLFPRDNVKSLTLYLDLSRYYAATLLTENSKSEREYKNNILYSLRNTKYSSSIEYGIMPMCGEISRKSFLVLMHNLLSDSTSTSEDTIINNFYEADVIEGTSESYKKLELEKNLQYSDMLTFLRRFENYDFSSNSSVTEEEE